MKTEYSLACDVAIGAVIRTERCKRGLSQSDLAAQLQLRGIDLENYIICKIESGRRACTFMELFAICSVLQVPLSDLPLPSAVR